MPATAVAACSDEAVGSSSDDVTSVENTGVKSQAIANCWLYATAGWAESLHKGVTGRDLDLSEAYWNYWYWYEQISGGSISLYPTTGIAESGNVTQGGWWGVGAELIRRYGYMNETDFMPESDAKAARHTAAAEAIDAALASGTLRDPAARRDPRIVRAALNEAWGLSPEVAKALEAVFPIVAPPASAGDGAQDAGAASDAGAALPPPPAAVIDLADRKGMTTSSPMIHAPQELPVLSASDKRTLSLADVVGTKAEGTKLGDGIRTGEDTWSELRYTWNESEIGHARRDALLKNLRHVMNQRLAVPVGWVVSNTAKEGAYRNADVTDYSLGGLHESVLVDYEIDDVPGFGSLRVDERETRPEALEATLSDGAEVRFFRIKNSWGVDRVWTAEEMRQYGMRPEADGGERPKPNFLPSKPGFNDLFVDYLDRPTARGNKIDGHVMLRLAMPSKLRFAVPDMPLPPADGGAEAGATEAGAR